jgi:hypothetical protein
MNVGSWLLWGFAATLLLTTLLSTSQGLRLTRLNIPYLLGTLLTADRDRARALGFALHFVNGFVFSFVYVAIFESLHAAGWWRGALLGVGHAAFVLAAAVPLLPVVHPRMASETDGPTAVRQIEPPGFLALHYGARTPISILVAHVAFGAVLGAFYQLR